MVNLNERHPVEHIVGFIGVILLHILVIWVLVILMRSDKDTTAELLPMQVQIVDVASSASSSSAASSQPPAPEMIMPPPPEMEPPPINTEAPPQPKPPPVVKQPKVKKPKVTHPSNSEPSQEPSPNLSAQAGTKGQGASTAGSGPPDRSAGSRPINGAQIQYPPDMEAIGKEGRVILSCDVETNGSTSNCTAISVNGGSSFKEAALNYARRARYRPATRNGVPVKEYGHRYTVTFRLSD
ncbi:energy transducer TonB [Commensalibacter oyaizuii]|uniref:Protein TonB n=1 Tax=Commensalibacter oyaizuii TaxID=3043873 RepID=A0ABT6Q3K5_9PROT|nr:energy transducer TonB [Commensalibacter sp. TBRC 16381]MDI2091716.1 energy transducer TonB [Commensalibacter sp. TBRC 16381]